jgi:hypothetical protein
MLAVRLANLMTDLYEAQRPTDKRVARAKVEGACEAVYELGYGQTPFAVYQTVLDWITANERPQGYMAFNNQRKAWTARAETELTELLDALK